jgi:hypothetical protein
VTPGGPRALPGSPRVQPVAPAAAGEAADMAAIDRAARAQAASQAGLSPDEARRVEQIHLETDRRRQEIQKRSEWASDEDLSAIHDNAAAEQQALKSTLGPERAQILRGAERQSYQRMLRETPGHLRGQMQLLRLSDGAGKALAPQPPAPPPTEP